jgi:ABC-type Co2+ transport system permease subunit
MTIRENVLPVPWQVFLVLVAALVAFAFVQTIASKRKRPET